MATPADAMKYAKSYTDKKVMKRRIPVKRPSNFDWEAPIDILMDGEGKFETDFDISQYKYVGAGKSYYVSLKNGSDSNDGLTLENAFRTVHKAIAQPDVDIVYIDEGHYGFANAFNNQSVNRSCSLIALPNKKVQLSTWSNPSWSLASGYTKTYQATRSLASRVFDSNFIDENGDEQELILRSSVAEVEANPGSWYTDGTYVYVHTVDSRQPDSTIWIFLDTKNFSADGEYTVYIEGIEFLGGNYPFRLANASYGLNPKLYAKDCKFKYGVGNGLHILGAEVYLQNCESAKNNEDGFNYHINNGIVPKVIEIECVGRDNGISGNNDNGSTIHDGGKIIRINGTYYSNAGPNVADVSLDTRSWNLGCLAFNSLGTDIQQSDYQIADSGEAWYDYCTSFGSLYPITITGSASGNLRNNRHDNEVYSTGTVNYY